MNADLGPMCKGAIFKVNADFIKRICGQDGLDRVVAKVGRKWPHFTIAGIKEKDWLPLDMRIGFLEACKSELGWDDRRLQQMGADAAQQSSIIMSFISYFLTVNKALHHAPEIWTRNYSTGKIKVLVNEKGRGKLALSDFKHSPILCTYLAGFFHGVGTKVAKAADIKVTEEKCVHKGADSCIFSFRWDE